MLLTLRSLYETVGAVLVTAVGVSASPVIGAPSVKVTYALSGVSASSAIGASDISTSAPIFGVAASAAIGPAQVNVADLLSGVSGSPAIGVGSFSSDFTLSGVVAGANVGLTRVNVSALISGVAASPAIGIGTVETPSLGQVIVNLEGVSASPQIGTGTIEIQSGGVTYPRAISEGGPMPRRATRRPIPVYVQPVTEPEPIRVAAKGVRAYARNGKLTFNACAQIVPVSPTLSVIKPGGTITVNVTGNAVAANLVAGYGAIKTVIDLTDEEIITLMEAA